MVSKDVVEYVEMFAGQVPPKDDLAIDIYTEESTDNFDKKRIRKAVKRHYAEKILNQSKAMKKDILWGSILLVLGILVAALEFLVLYVWGQPFVDLLISIIAWTFFWDGFEMLAIDLPKLRVEQIKNYRMMRAKVHVRQYSQAIKREFGICEYEE